MKILFFTGSRGEWGYIRPILELCKKKKIKYEICASNTHILPSFGNTYKEIENSGFKINYKTYMTIDGYNDFTTAKSLGLIIQSFVDILVNAKPDIVLLAGDRGETFAVSVAAAYSNIPIAHIQAGELSGNIDGMARHAIGKMAHIHFASNKDAYKRLIKLGEEKFRIHEVGATQLDDIAKKKFKNKSEVKYKFDLNYSKKNIISIFHPVTEDQKSNFTYLKRLINASKKVNANFLWILPNGDSGSKLISDTIIKNCDRNSKVFRNISREYFLGLMAVTNCMVGNSSSALLEAPSFKLPALNIGRRQHMRIREKNVIDLKSPSEKQIINKINYLLKIDRNLKYKNLRNPYGEGNSSEKIIKIITKLYRNKALLVKNMEY